MDQGSLLFKKKKKKDSYPVLNSSQKNRDDSPGPSSVSMKSDGSMYQPANFGDKQHQG